MSWTRDVLNESTLAGSILDDAASWSRGTRGVPMQVGLVERAMRGDQEAFASLAATAVNGCYRLAFRILRDPHRAEDATQQALLGAWRDLPTLRKRMQSVSGRAMAAPLTDGRVAVLPQWSAEQEIFQDLFGERTGVSPVGELFDPTTLTFTPALGSLPSIADSATPLTGGRQLVTGAVRAGTSAATALRSWAVVYDPRTGATTDLPAPVGRLPGTAALPDGRVVLAWGYGLDDYASTGNSESLGVETFQ